MFLAGQEVREPKKPTSNATCCADDGFRGVAGVPGGVRVTGDQNSILATNSDDLYLVASCYYSCNARSYVASDCSVRRDAPKNVTSSFLLLVATCS